MQHLILMGHQIWMGFAKNRMKEEAPEISNLLKGVLMSESSGATPLSVPAGDMLKPKRSWKTHICRAAASGDWNDASSYDETHPNWFCIPLTDEGDTAQHIAVSMQQIDFLKNLVQRMSVQDMEILNENGNTAFCMAAILGNVDIAIVLLEKNPRLTWIRGQEDMLPIQLASSAGHVHMANFLFQRIQHDIDSNLTFKDIVRVFFMALASSIYSVASTLLDTYPKLASEENDKGLTALELLAQLSADCYSPGYRCILVSLAKLMIEELPNSRRASKAMFSAAKAGNMMILEPILKCNPNLLTRVNSKRQSLLHIAVLYRQKTVFRKILSMGAYKNAIIHKVDCDGNNVLHIAGKLAAEGRFGSPMHQVLIRSEEMWFKEVEKIVPPAFQTMTNDQGLTPQEVFYKEHKDLSEKTVSELDGIASNMLVVGTLIVTLGITGALTIRTNPPSPGHHHPPIFDEDTWYIIFIMSVAVGVASSAVSMLLFTSVLLPSMVRSRTSGNGSGNGYVTSLLIRTTFGYLLFYASVATIGSLSVISGFALIYSFFSRWVFCLIGAFIAVAVVSSVVIYFYSLKLSLLLILSFGEDHAVKILRAMAIGNNCPFNNLPCLSDKFL